jgi:hypothetical protein
MTHRRAATLWLGAKDFAVLGVYLLTVCVAAFHYVPWDDEARGWMLARDYDLYTLVFRALRYEGHPPLWYLILWLPAHLHMPFVLITWLAAAIASVGIYVFLRYCPFPFYLRALIPFGFFLGYQYAVVARSYVLFPLLGFAAAHLYRQRLSNPIAMAAVLALLASVSIHGSVVAISMAALYAWRLAKERRAAVWPAGQSRRIQLGAGLFAASILLLAVCLWPSDDMTPPVSPSVAKIVRHVLIPVHAIRPYHPHGEAARLIDSGGQPLVRSSQSAKTAPGSSRRFLLHRLATVLGYPVATFYPLAFCFEALVLVYLYRNRTIVLILPAALLAIFMTLVLAQLWHTGLFWVTLLMVLWMAWDSPPRPRVANMQRIVGWVLALICVLQLPWTLAAIHYEKSHATNPAKAAADYLKTLPPATRMDALGLGFTVLPYFKDKLFLDQTRRPFDRHEIYTASGCTYCDEEVLTAHPDLILADGKTLDAQDWETITVAGYRPTHSFCGASYFPHWPIVATCLLVLERPRGS